MSLIGNEKVKDIFEILSLDEISKEDLQNLSIVLISNKLLETLDLNKISDEDLDSINLNFFTKEQLSNRFNEKELARKVYYSNSKSDNMSLKESFKERISKIENSKLNFDKFNIFPDEIKKILKGNNINNMQELKEANLEMLKVDGDYTIGSVTIEYLSWAREFYNIDSHVESKCNQLLKEIALEEEIKKALGQINRPSKEFSEENLLNLALILLENKIIEKIDLNLINDDDLDSLNLNLFTKEQLVERFSKEQLAKKIYYIGFKPKTKTKLVETLKEKISKEENSKFDFNKFNAFPPEIKKILDKNEIHNVQELKEANLETLKVDEHNTIGPVTIEYLSWAKNFYGMDAFTDSIYENLMRETKEEEVRKISSHTKLKQKIKI